MVSACFAIINVTSCNNAALVAIDQARAAEGLSPLVLPSGFYSLDLEDQVIALINAERTSRGLPAFSTNAAYEPAAQAAAQAGTDPTGPSGTEWTSIYAAGYPTALAADFSWMYDDGAGSPNVDCTTSDTSGCWGHRNDILSPWAGSAAAASLLVNGSLTLTALFVAA